MLALSGAAVTVAAILAGCSSGATSAQAPTAASLPAGEAVPADEAAPADDADVSSYVASMTALAEREQELLDRYGSVTGDKYRDDATTLAVLVELLPDVSAFIADLEAVIPPPGPIADAHEVYVDAWNTQAEGMILVTSAIEQQDLTLVADGNEKLADGRALMRDAQAQLTSALQDAS